VGVGGGGGGGGVLVGVLLLVLLLITTICSIVAMRHNRYDKQTSSFNTRAIGPSHRRHDTVSERLRRWTRNPLGSARRSSNPLGVDFRYLARAL
jgi:hypothetical protein